MILCPLLPAFFFQVSHNFMKHCSCSVTLSPIFSFPLSFLSFLLFCRRARCFHDIFSPSGHIYYPPPGGGYFPKYRPLKSNNQKTYLNIDQRVASLSNVVHLVVELRYHSVKLRNQSSFPPKSTNTKNIIFTSNRCRKSNFQAGLFDEHRNRWPKVG